MNDLLKLPMSFYKYRHDNRQPSWRNEYIFQPLMLATSGLTSSTDMTPGALESTLVYEWGGIVVGDLWGVGGAVGVAGQCTPL